MTNSPQQKYNNPVSATLTGIRDLFRKQIPAGTLNPTDRLDGKTVLVDGASSGLGFAVATGLARRGAKVIMACRSGIPEKGERVKKLSGNMDIHMLHVDFSDIASIGELVKQIKAKFAPLDILVCNAGIVPKQSRKTKQGLEEMFMVNYFSKFIFLNLLLENQCLNEVDPPRIIFVASESHRNPEKFQWDEFGKYKEYQIGKSIELYGYYKLLLTTFSCELSRRLNPNGETRYSVFSLCPGPVNSNIAREAPKVFIPVLKLVFGIFFKSPSKAAIPVIYLAASHDFDGKAFDYLFLMSRKAVDEKASDPENGRQLWKLSEALQESLQTV
jgi:NAD(P)-dependent dehydrogenase (short-subunit alcohol dehydrogenase family)